MAERTCVDCGTGLPKWAKSKLCESCRFWSKVDKAGPVPLVRPDLGPCWLWTAGRSKGYGVFTPTSPRKNVHAYRYAYIALTGPIPEDLTLDHLCRNPPCVNPAHLEAVTGGENTRRGESFAAVNARKTRCDSGHEFTPENTYVRPTGSRTCRTCMRGWQSAEKWRLQRIEYKRRARAHLRTPPSA